MIPQKITLLPMSALGGQPLAFNPGWQVNGEHGLSFGQYPTFAEAMNVAKIHGTPPNLPQWQTALFDIPSTVNLQTGEITLHFDAIEYSVDPQGFIQQHSADQPSRTDLVRGLLHG